MWPRKSKVVLCKRKPDSISPHLPPLLSTLPPRIIPTPSPFSPVPELPFRGLGTKPVGNNGQWNPSCQLQHQHRLPPQTPKLLSPSCLGTTLPPLPSPLATPSHPRNINAPFIPTWQVYWKEGDAKREEGTQSKRTGWAQTQASKPPYPGGSYVPGFEDPSFPVSFSHSLHNSFCRNWHKSLAPWLPA